MLTGDRRRPRAAAVVVRDGLIAGVLDHAPPRSAASEIAARLWADRLGHAYPYRQLFDAGARLAAGSDAPVEELDPLAGLASALECGLTFDDALESFTAAPAWLEGAEARRGRIAEGLAADLVLVEGDLVRDPARAEVKETLRGGEALPH